MLTWKTCAAHMLTHMQHAFWPWYNQLLSVFCVRYLNSTAILSDVVFVCVRAKEMVILGTQYAGEMKKGIFTVMHYLMPKRGILSLHSGCNVGKNDDVTLFFGLSGILPSYKSSSLVAYGHVSVDKPVPGREHGVFMMLRWQAFLLCLHLLSLQPESCPVQECFHWNSNTA